MMDMIKKEPPGIKDFFIFMCMERAFQPVTLGPLTLKNRFIKSATYEGFFDEGMPTQGLTDHHAALARGGVGLTTVSYGAVSPEGRTFHNQMYIHEGTLPALAGVAEAVHRAGVKISMQLTHCGFFTKNKEAGKPLGPSRLLNQYGLLNGLPFSKEMDRDDMDRTAGHFALAAERLAGAGYDAVEVHMGHGYLLSQFLSPATNRRKDAYGGPIANRARFPLEVFRQVKERVGHRLAVLVKLNMSDGFRGGLTVEESSYVARELERLGADALVLTGGFTSKTPFYLMRGEVPLKGMIQNGENAAEKISMALFGPLIVKKYPFTPLFFLDQALQIRRSVKMPLAYLGGVDGREDISRLMDAGFDLIALARPLIHDPQFLQKLQRGEIDRTACDRCNECVVEMDRGGVRCVK